MFDCRAHRATPLDSPSPSRGDRYDQPQASARFRPSHILQTPHPAFDEHQPSNVLTLLSTSWSSRRNQVQIQYDPVCVMFPPASQPLSQDLSDAVENLRPPLMHQCERFLVEALRGSLAARQAHPPQQPLSLCATFRYASSAQSDALSAQRHSVASRTPSPPQASDQGFRRVDETSR